MRRALLLALGIGLAATRALALESAGTGLSVQNKKVQVNPSVVAGANGAADASGLFLSPGARNDRKARSVMVTKESSTARCVCTSLNFTDNTVTNTGAVIGDCTVGPGGTVVHQSD